MSKALLFKVAGPCNRFNAQPSPSHGVCREVAVFHNSNSYDINNFSFMIAVPKFIKVQFKPANGTQLMARSQNCISQKFQLSNTMYGIQPFQIRIQVICSEGPGAEKNHRISRTKNR